MLRPINLIRSDFGERVGAVFVLKLQRRNRNLEAALANELVCPDPDGLCVLQDSHGVRVPSWNNNPEREHGKGDASRDKAHASAQNPRLEWRCFVIFPLATILNHLYLYP